MLATWKQEADELLRQAETLVDDEGMRLLSQLKKVGPLHNIEATRTIVKSLSDRSKPIETTDAVANVD